MRINYLMLSLNFLFNYYFENCKRILFYLAVKMIFMLLIFVSQIIGRGFKFLITKRLQASK